MTIIEIYVNFYYMKRKDIMLGLLIAVFLAIIISPFASKWPDGLEKVAERLGFIEKGEGPPALKSPMPDYSWPGIKNEALATILSGVFGAFLVFGLGYGVAALLRKKR